MKCIEPGCNEEAGTPWTPYWCKKHDDERKARIDEGMRRIMARLEGERKANQQGEGVND